MAADWHRRGCILVLSGVFEENGRVGKESESLILTFSLIYV